MSLLGVGRPEERSGRPSVGLGRPSVGLGRSSVGLGRAVKGLGRPILLALPNLVRFDRVSKVESNVGVEAKDESAKKKKKNKNESFITF